jgi:dihydrofolate reductase
MKIWSDAPRNSMQRTALPVAGQRRAGRERTDEMSKIIAALVVSVDGFIEGPNGELDWVDTWEDPFDLLPQIDTCILGRGMYPGYEKYWSAILANPGGILPFTGKVATKGEIAYAQFAERTPHIVLSRTLDKVAWKNTRIVREVEEIRRMKQQPGRDMHAVGGATLIGSLMNQRLIDELRLVVHPMILGGGKALFKDVTERHALTFLGAKPLASGLVRLTYRT